MYPFELEFDIFYNYYVPPANYTSTSFYDFPDPPSGNFTVNNTAFPSSQPSTQPSSQPTTMPTMNGTLANATYTVGEPLPRTGNFYVLEFQKRLYYY